jgi:hypothetical protein
MENLSTESVRALESQLLAELERRERQDPVSFFPWHEHQQWVLHDAMKEAKKDVRVVLACGGNRGGKSALGKGIFSEFVRRKSELAHKLRTTDRLTGEVRRKHDKDPVTVWIIPPTLEKARQDWVSPSDGYSVRYWLGDLFMAEKKSPDHIFYSRPPGLSPEEAQRYYDEGEFERLDKTILKSHDQDLLSFEASAVDLCIVDEEIQDEAKWNSMLLRIGTPNGTIVMCYTPLYGLSWSYDRYWRPLVKGGVAREYGERRWISDRTKGACVVATQFGAADNPLAAEYAEEIENDPGMSDAEKNARLYGEYGFVEGALIPALSGIDIVSPEKDHRIYVLDKLPPDTDVEEWLLVTDPNKSWGATLSLITHNGDVIFVSEHLEEAWPDRKHAASFKTMERKHVKPWQSLRRVADPGSAGAQAIVNMQDLGVPFMNVEKGKGSVAAGVKRMRSYAWVDPEHPHPITGELGAPRLYFYRPGILSRWRDKNGRLNISCRLADQISMARQTDNDSAPPDTPHKDVRSKLDLFDCGRYTCMEIRHLMHDDGARGKKRHPHDMLANLPPVKRKPQIQEPLDRDFFVPEYFE